MFNQNALRHAVLVTDVVSVAVIPSVGDKTIFETGTKRRVVASSHASSQSPWYKKNTLRRHMHIPQTTVS